MPTPTPLSSLKIVPGPLKEGFNFRFYIRLAETITELFDYYIVADTQFGPYTLYFDGNVEGGIKSLYSSVPGYPAPFEKTIICNTVLPMTMGGKQVIFYSVIIQAGKKPPVRRLSDLTPDTQYVIMMDKKTVMVD
jgi:hypothetical protein